MSHPLNSCPFCGGEAWRITNTPYTTCKSCGAVGPEREKPDDAEEAWDARASCEVCHWLTCDSNGDHWCMVNGPELGFIVPRLDISCPDYARRCDAEVSGFDSDGIERISFCTLTKGHEGAHVYDEP